MISQLSLSSRRLGVTSYITRNPKRLRNCQKSSKLMVLHSTLSYSLRLLVVTFQSNSSTRSESEGNEIEDLDEGDVQALPPIYFASKEKGMPTEDVAKLILGTPIDERVATYRPLDVSSNRVYVFKTDCFADIQDILTDGCGLWKATGTKTFYAEKQDHGSIKLVVHPHSRQGIFTIERRFYCHSQFKDVKRNFVLMKGT